MTTSRHKITATRSGHTNGMDWEAEYTITFLYRPAAPDFWSTAGGHWEQGYGLEIEYMSHDPVSDYGPAAENEAEWCKDWLDENAAECADSAEQDNQPDPDAARDARIDREMMERGR